MLGARHAAEWLQGILRGSVWPGKMLAEAETACAEESEVGCTTKHPDSKFQAASLARACLSGDERSLQTAPIARFSMTEHRAQRQEGEGR